ncbi:MAG: hypothetical protein EBV77_06280 [Gemmatimonadaceae bacterium]|nr:hypothetical protein [Gemmatimonadaceae bacterium]
MLVLVLSKLIIHFLFHCKLEILIIILIIILLFVFIVVLEEVVLIMMLYIQVLIFVIMIYLYLHKTEIISNGLCIKIIDLRIFQEYCKLVTQIIL